MREGRKSDKGMWFISLDGSTALKCQCDNFTQYLKTIFPAERIHELRSQFRQATFEEYCDLELF